jgi:hypothetical protein
LQTRFLSELGKIAPNLTTYQSGAIAPAQIISNGDYVLKDAGEIRKFQADLNYFIQGSNHRIGEANDINEQVVTELLEFLTNKGYQTRNIQAALQERIIDSAANRETVSNLSRPSL